MLPNRTSIDRPTLLLVALIVTGILGGCKKDGFEQSNDLSVETYALTRAPLLRFLTGHASQEIPTEHMTFVVFDSDCRGIAKLEMGRTSNMDFSDINYLANDENAVWVVDYFGNKCMFHTGQLYVLQPIIYLPGELSPVLLETRQMSVQFHASFDPFSLDQLAPKWNIDVTAESSNEQWTCSSQGGDLDGYNIGEHDKWLSHVLNIENECGN
jgi:hypothetical protein